MTDERKAGNNPLGPKALEMVMRDVLDGMADLAILDSWEMDTSVDILGIEAASEPGTHADNVICAIFPASGSATGAAESEILHLDAYRRRQAG